MYDFFIDLTLLGIIIQDQNIQEAIQAQEPFLLRYPESLASKSIQSIAKRLIEDQPEPLVDHGVTLFWDKCLHLITGPLNLIDKGKQIAANKTRSANQIISKASGKHDIQPNNH